MGIGVLIGSGAGFTQGAGVGLGNGIAVAVGTGSGVDMGIGAAVEDGVGAGVGIGLAVEVNTGVGLEVEERGDGSSVSTRLVAVSKDSGISSGLPLHAAMIKASKLIRTRAICGAFRRG